ncbi:MAG: TIM barrel protein [Acidobacteria bacterium]|nr:TIM barrel protein [Acidobacteriota bacterium]
MTRREFLSSATAAAAAPVVFARRAGAQRAAADPAKLARLAIMSLTFGPVLKSPTAPDDPKRTLDIMDLGEMFADRFGVHNVELQHSYLLSTDDAYLAAFRTKLERTKSRVSNVNLELGGAMTISADTQVGRWQAVDLTRRWIDHCVTLGCPRIMINQGQLTEQNRAIAIATLKSMSDYGKAKGVKVSLEPRGAGGGTPAAPPPFVLLTDVIEAAGAYANVDLANFGDQPAQHAGMRAMFPFTVGNTHMRLVPARYDLPIALRMMREEFKYTGIYSIEQGIPAGPDPYASIDEVRGVVLEHM